MNPFKDEIMEGLRKPLKSLPSKYFYDAKGDSLFQQIMELEEYYLPGCEREIISQKAEEIARVLKAKNPCWNVIELGAGDGSKTIELLKGLADHDLRLHYTALDISPNILKVNKANVLETLPHINAETVTGNYFETYDEVLGAKKNNLVLFMGGNIGNYTLEKAAWFFQWMSESMNRGDYALVAFDLKKHPKVILDAYNDKRGITKLFNINLLTRINRELDANFIIEHFDHYPYYDPVSGNAYSFLVSLVEQEAQIGAEKFHFKRNEVIHTEISKKYNLEEIESLGSESGFSVSKHFLDEKAYYSLSLFVNE